MYKEQKECITLCWEARTRCLETLTQHCLKKGGMHVDENHVKIMLDCIDICQAAADFMERGSTMHKTICAACAEICDACARSCEEMAGDERMLECAKACRRCADLCRNEGRKLSKVA